MAKTTKKRGKYRIRLTKKNLEKIIKDMIEKGNDDIKLKAIKLWKEIEAEERAIKQTQREKVIKRVVDDEKLQELIKFKPHQKQKEVLECNANEIVICAGRQSGKTILCAYYALKTLLEEDKSVCLIAPSYSLCGRVLDYLRIWIGKYFKGEMVVYNKPFPRIVTKWGSILEAKSTEQPDQILGKGYDLIIVDECTRIPEKIHHTYIIPASGIKLGKYFYISTPRGRDWFWKLWRKAKEKGAAFHWASLENPYFDRKKWEQEKKRLPETIFRQEYMAEFLERAVVFAHIDDCIKNYSIPLDYNENHLYVMGVDLGKYEDYTAIVVIDMMTNQVADAIFFQGDWDIQKERIKAMADKYGKCPIWMDATSVSSGDIFVQQLSDEGYHVMGYKISSNVSKRQLIEKAIVLIQNGDIALPAKGGDSEELINQLRAFTFTKTLAGIIKYHAPSGEHDDLVIAFALACWELEESPLPELKDGKVEVYLPPEQEF